MIALADQPMVGAESVRRLIAAHAAGATVVVAAYDGRPRNPVLIDRTHWAEVLATTTGDAGARPFLRAHPDLVTAVECGDTGRPDDIDTPEDLARAALVDRTKIRLIRSRINVGDSAVPNDRFVPLFVSVRQIGAEFAAYCSPDAPRSPLSLADVAKVRRNAPSVIESRTG